MLRSCKTSKEEQLVAACQLMNTVIPQGSQATLQHS